MSARSGTLSSANSLALIVERLGKQISTDHPEGVVIVGVLKGSFCLVADLIRSITVPCLVDFLALSAYGPHEARVRIVKDLDLDVKAHQVVLALDVVDTGLSSGYVVGLLRQRGATSVRLCALLDRPSRRIVPIAPDYVGLQAPDDFVVGYGLDFAERYRNLPSIEIADPKQLELDPAAFERAVY